MQLRSSRIESVSATIPNICQFVAIRGIRGLCGIGVLGKYGHIFSIVLGVYSHILVLFLVYIFIFCVIFVYVLSNFWYCFS